jgi:uncharacterized protein
MTKKGRFLMRVLKLSAIVIALFILGTVPAYAHVTVTGDGAVSAGKDATITFRVPTESDTLSTVGLVVALPTDTPIASVNVLAMPGWTETEKTVHLATPIHTDDGDITDAVSEVDWTATGEGIKPGSFGEFTLIAGLLPNKASLTFKAVQTYSDQSKVSWIQTPAPGVSADSLDHPAPVLTLGAAGASDPSASSTGPTVTASAVAAPASTTLPTTLSIVALVLALLAVVLAVLRWRRRPRPDGSG